ncbi:MAG: hypothetical protein A2341_28585 [Deltaproteobacteria bacterium RIFOXYB12_FULL_58_9]|nr:MAG: hypothetical protein A2341_28585 [Deltaproteobacteria bacterium RIFOXYB12_FULL_58_9]
MLSKNLAHYRFCLVTRQGGRAASQNATAQQRLGALVLLLIRQYVPLGALVLLLLRQYVPPWCFGALVLWCFGA